MPQTMADFVIARLVRAIHGDGRYEAEMDCVCRRSGAIVASMRERIYYVYILASQPNGTLYTGITNDLSRRIYEHREGLIEGFTKKYNVKRLVYFEQFPTAGDAIHREKRIKKYPRAWKVNLIRTQNPDWHDLAEGLNA